jgi:hypothetical protein
MTDRAKFEQMLEYLINEDKSKAEELFHELIVAKSREIYENLLDDDIQVEASDEDEKDEDEDDLEENFGMDEVGADPADDMMGDLEAGDEEGDDMGGDDMGDEGGDTPATKDDVLDIKDALEDLKAEFEAMLAGEKGEEHGEEEMGDEEGEEGEEHGFGGDEEEQEEEFVREYVEKVGAPTHGDNGTNARSIVAGKNDMGGTSANIAKGGTSTTGGTQGGLLKPSTTDLKSGNVNVPGGKAGIKHLKGVSKPAGGDNGQNSNSPLNGAPGRAK